MFMVICGDKSTGGRYDTVEIASTVARACSLITGKKTIIREVETQKDIVVIEPI